MKLSIITINRNNAEGLRKTIESVVSQTFTDFEIILIDDASPNDSVAQLQDKLPPNTVFLPQQRTDGISGKPISGIQNKSAHHQP